MKLFILKLLSLLVFCLGLVSLGIALGLPEVQSYLLDPALGMLASAQDKLPPALDFLKDALTPRALWFGGSIVAVVFGIYGFLPRRAKYRKNKKIIYEGPHGEVQIQLNSVEQSLNQVLARMPEIKKINVRVDPQDNGRKAFIRADVVLHQQPGQNARAIASLVSDYIAETATKLLGLEEVATIDLNVTGIIVNSRKSSKAIRKESLSHSANAPVELLEAAPAPLTLSGPGGQPLGSGPIEEELDEDAESERAMETNASDTRQDETNQAAARSELLEPLSMGEAMHHEPAGGEHGAPAGAAHEKDRAGDTPEEAEPPRAEASVAPIQMDVLDESLEEETEADEEPETFADDGGEDEEEAEKSGAGDGLADGDELSGDVEPEAEAEEAPDTAPADHAGEYGDGGEQAPDGDFSPETDSGKADGAETGASGDYPWEKGAPAAVDTSVESADSGFQPGAPIGEDAIESGLGGESDGSDSILGDTPGEVTIPEADDESHEPHGADKKRWGGWFN